MQKNYRKQKRVQLGMVEILNHGGESLFRTPEALKQTADIINKKIAIPINTEHVFTDQSSNFEAVGTVTKAEIDDKGKLFADVALWKMPASNKVSLGYTGDVIRKNGIFNGVPYTHILKSVSDVDHVSITPNPRSPGARFLDSLDEQQVYIQDSFEIDFADSENGEYVVEKQHLLTGDKKPFNIKEKANMDYTIELKKIQDALDEQGKLINKLTDQFVAGSASLKDSLEQKIELIRQESEKKSIEEKQKSELVSLADSKGFTVNASKTIKEICSELVLAIQKETGVAKISDSIDAVLTALSLYTPKQKESNIIKEKKEDFEDTFSKIQKPSL